MEYYDRLFKYEARVGGQFNTGAFLPLEAGVCEDPTKEYTEEETRLALRGIGSYKAPGLDGYQAVFFKSSWSVVGTAVHSL